MLLVKTTRNLVKTTRQFSTTFAVVLCKYLFYSFIFINWQFNIKSIHSSTAVFEHGGKPLFLEQESREVFVVFIEIMEFCRSKHRC